MGGVIIGHEMGRALGVEAEQFCADAAAATVEGVRLWRAPDSLSMRKAARGLFNYSLSYLFVLFLGLLADHVATNMGVL